MSSRLVMSVVLGLAMTGMSSMAMAEAPAVKGQFWFSPLTESTTSGRLQPARPSGLR